MATTKRDSLVGSGKEKKATKSISRSSSSSSSTSIPVVSTSLQSKNVPNYLKPTLASRTTTTTTTTTRFVKKQHVPSAPDHEASQKAALLNRRRSFDKPPSVSRVHNALVSPGPKERKSLPIRASSFSTTSSKSPTLSTRTPTPKSSQPVKTMRRSMTSPAPSRKGQTQTSSSKKTSTDTTPTSTSMPRSETMLEDNATLPSEIGSEPDLIPSGQIEKQGNTSNSSDRDVGVCQVINNIDNECASDKDQSSKTKHKTTTFSEDQLMPSLQIHNDQETEEHKAHEEDETLNELNGDGEEMNHHNHLGDEPQEAPVEDTKNAEDEPELEAYHNSSIGEDDQKGKDCDGVKENVVSIEGGKFMDEKENEMTVDYEGESEEKERDHHHPEDGDGDQVRRQEEDARKRLAAVTAPTPEVEEEKQQQHSSDHKDKGKKESPVYNDVIKQTASKLLEKRKNKVSALVGAFETVISLQEPET